MEKKNLGSVTFAGFLELFPEVELPLTLGENSHHTFSELNKPLNARYIETYLTPHLGEADEFTEHIPCFSIPATASFHGIVCWRADLKSYQYFLMTFSTNGKFIDKKFIAGSKWEEDIMMNVVTTIDVDWIIYQNIGSQKLLDGNNPTPSDNKLRTLELMADGDIISTTN